MGTSSDEKIVLEIKTLFFGGIDFLVKKGGILSMKSFRGVHIYLTNKNLEIYSRILLVKELKIFEVLLPDILYFRKDEKLWRRIRLGYRENNEEKEILLILKKKDINILIRELNKLIS